MEKLPSTETILH